MTNTSESPVPANEMRATPWFIRFYVIDGSTQHRLSVFCRTDAEAQARLMVLRPACPKAYVVTGRFSAQCYREDAEGNLVRLAEES